MTITRRTLAKGAAWAAPVIAASTLAPAYAASPCALYKKGQPLPASAFTVTYLIITTDGQGLANDRQINLDFGFRISGVANACGVTSGAITSEDGPAPSRARLNDPAKSGHDMSNGLSIPANGTVGTTYRTCRTTTPGTEACGSTGGSRYSVANTSSSRSYYFDRISLSRRIQVSGYGASDVFFNASMVTTGGAPFDGSNFSVTANSIV